MDGPRIHGTLLHVPRESGGEDVFYVDAPQGSTFHVAFSIRNAGAHGVTLLGPPNPGPLPQAGLFPVVSASIGPHDLNAVGPGDHLGGGHYPRQFRTLSGSHPASLRGGDDRLVYFTVRLNGHCVGGGVAHGDRNATVEWVSSIPMRYRVAGIFTRTQELPLPYVLALACHGKGISSG
jgi:hypothetical protein